LIVGLDLGQLVVESGHLFEIKRWKFDRLLLLLLRWLGVVRNSFEFVGVLHTLPVPFFDLLTEIDEGGGIVVSVDSGTHLQVQEHRGHLAGRTDEHLNFATLNRVVARLTASLLEGEEVLSPPGGEVVGILHLIELVLLVPSLALDIIRVRGHVDWLIPLFNMSSRSVSNLHLARKSAGELSIAVLVFVGEPLIEDLAVLEHLGGQLDSELEVPSVVGAFGSVELVATEKSLPAELLRTLPVGEVFGQLELVPVLQVLDNLEFVLGHTLLFEHFLQVSLGRSDINLVRVLPDVDRLSVFIVRVDSASDGDVILAEDFISRVELALELDLSSARLDHLTISLLILVEFDLLGEAEGISLGGALSCVLFVPSLLEDTSVLLIIHSRVAFERVDPSLVRGTNLGGTTDSPGLRIVVTIFLERHVLVDDLAWLQLFLGSGELELEVKHVILRVVIWVGLEANIELLCDLAILFILEDVTSVVLGELPGIGDLSRLHLGIDLLELEVSHRDVVLHLPLGEALEVGRILAVVEATAKSELVGLVEELSSLLGSNLNLSNAHLSHLAVDSRLERVVGQIPVAVEVLLLLLVRVVLFPSGQILLLR
jgi:hypothetical protein